MADEDVSAEQTCAGLREFAEEKCATKDDHDFIVDAADMLARLKNIDGLMIANDLLHHIDTMYPDMWKNVAKTARTSIRNTIIRQLRVELREAERG